MAAKTISVKLSTQPDNGLKLDKDGLAVKISATKKPNRLEADKDGLFVSKPTFYAGTADEKGHGLVPTGWRQSVHQPNRGYVINLHPSLAKEGYSVVCSPRIPSSTQTAPDQPGGTPVVFAPITTFVHHLDDDHFHIHIVDTSGKPIDHPFTWLLMVPE